MTLLDVFRRKGRPRRPPLTMNAADVQLPPEMQIPLPRFAEPLPGVEGRWIFGAELQLLLSDSGFDCLYSPLAEEPQGPVLWGLQQRSSLSEPTALLLSRFWVAQDFDCADFNTGDFQRARLDEGKQSADGVLSLGTAD